MRRLIAATATVVIATACAVGTSFGIVSLLDRVPEQPNVPLVTYETTPASR
ncbi:hypothetical protein [Streptomyces sp. NPDC093105]|uniref:hypothetical protein n=1 Tax=Streptomyces sp. NPDC093105 TaxID=3366029 RepID=UPI0037F44C0B